MILSHHQNNLGRHCFHNSQNLFIAEVDTIDSTLVWIYFPSLNMVFYDDSFLLGLASFIGKPIKVDTNTLNAYWGRYGLGWGDLSKPVVVKVIVHMHWYHFEYESLHLPCTSCGHYGHRSKDCPKKPPQMSTKVNPSINLKVTID